MTSQLVSEKKRELWRKIVNTVVLIAWLVFLIVATIWAFSVHPNLTPHWLWYLTVVIWIVAVGAIGVIVWIVLGTLREDNPAYCN